MVIIKRNVDGKEISREIRYHAQAAINSDGHLTIRAYDCGTDDEKSEIMTVLSENETRAVFRLFDQISNLINLTHLPF